MGTGQRKSTVSRTPKWWCASTETTTANAPIAHGSHVGLHLARAFTQVSASKAQAMNRSAMPETAAALEPLRLCT